MIGDDETMDSLEFNGVKVDLSRREVIQALNTCPITSKYIKDQDFTEPYIFYNDSYYVLGRTDLFDDIATGVCKIYSEKEWREYYLEKAKTCMGARLHDWGDRLGFSIIDSYSDG